MPPRTNTIVPDVKAVLDGLQQQRIESHQKLQVGWNHTEDWLVQALQVRPPLAMAALMLMKRLYAVDCGIFTQNFHHIY